MINLSRRRKAGRRHHHRRSNTIIHVNIRSIMNKSMIDQQNSLHMIPSMRKSDHHRSLPQSHQSTMKMDSSIKHFGKQENLLIANSSIINWSKSSKIVYDKATMNNNYDHIQVKNPWLEQTGNTIDHHQNVKKNKKKICPNRCVKISIILIAIISIIVIAIVLPLLLIKSTNVITPTAVLRWNTTGITVAGITGTLGTASNLLNTPLGATLDYQNNLYIADTVNNRIQKYLMGASSGSTVAGNASGVLGSGLNDLKRPTQVRIVSNGNMFVADTYNHRVMLWSTSSSSGVVVAGTTGIPSNTNSTLNTPYCIDYNLASNSLYVSDYTNCRVMRYLVGASSGSIVAGTGVLGKNITQLTNPVGIYFDSLSNSLIISSHFAYNIVRWPLGATSWTLLAGDINQNSGNSATSLYHATVVTLDPMGNLYVADRDNQRIQLFMSGQSVGITIAGVVNVTGSNSTLFNAPWSVALDSQLNLYVADSNNHRIQKF